MVDPGVLQNVVVALALGALVGLERERVPERKYAGLRTLSLLCAAGALSVTVAVVAGSVLPVAIYLLLGAAFSLLVILLRVWVEQEELGLTTSATVFLMTIVGVLTGYAMYFEAVATTLLAVFLLSEKKMLHQYTAGLAAEEISDAVKLGILALVLYPILPAGAVDPYNVLFLREALLFVIFILLIQFAAFLALKYFRTRISFLVAATLGGIVSSLATVSTVTRYVTEQDARSPAYAAAVAAITAMVVKNGFLLAVLASRTDVVAVVAAPFLAAALIGAGFVVWYHRTADQLDLDLGTESPFSFRSAFTFGIFFLTILMLAEVSQTYFAVSGVYGTAILGGIASSTAVVASAATLLASNSVTPVQAGTMVALGVTSSLLSKLVYVELGGARRLTIHLIAPSLLMAAAMLTVLL